MMKTIEIPYDGDLISFQMPGHLLGEIVAPNRLPAFEDVPHLIGHTLSHPIGSPPLQNLARPGQKVAVIIDDISRPTPTSVMLPPVLNCILGAGISKKDICIVIALGSHRPLTRKEIELKTGPEIARGYDIINIPCHENREMRSVGESSNGIPAEVNRWVADADLRIGIGAIGPHMDAGYSGGGKIILPGVCSCSSVNAFHAASADIAGNHLGNPEAPARLRLEKFVEEKMPLDFILNAVLHPDGGIYRCVSGHFIHAQRKGAEYAGELYGVRVRKRYPLVIANSYPFEIDFWQCTKAFWSGELMASDGGMVLLVSPCPEGTATHPLWAEYLEWEADDLKKMLDSGVAEDPNACAFAIMLVRMRKRVRFGIITPGIAAEKIKRMGLVHFDSIEEAMSVSIPSNMSHCVSVLPYGGVTVPVIDS